MWKAPENSPAVSRGTHHPKQGLYVRTDTCPPPPLLLGPHTHPPGLERTVLPAAHNVGGNMSLLLSCGRAQQPVAQPDPAGSTVPAQGGLKLGVLTPPAATWALGRHGAAPDSSPVRAPPSVEASGEALLIRALCRRPRVRHRLRGTWAQPSHHGTAGRGDSQVRAARGGAAPPRLSGQLHKVPSAHATWQVTPGGMRPSGAGAPLTTGAPGGPWTEGPLRVLSAHHGRLCAPHHAPACTHKAATPHF